MISGLRGKVNSFGASRVYIESSGVEYEVYVPLNVFEALQAESGELFLHIYHHFYQEGQRLFGFLDPHQREFFVAIQAIKGMGTSLALSILSHLSGEELLAVCERKEMEGLTRIPRIGKSTAETIVFEVNRKREKWKRLLAAPSAPVEKLDGVLDMVYQGLQQLGYKETQIRDVIERIMREAAGEGRNALDIGFPEWINTALRML
jgi:Holliday junction DNA helicase RuvA